MPAQFIPSSPIWVTEALPFILFIPWHSVNLSGASFGSGGSAPGALPVTVIPGLIVVVAGVVAVAMAPGGIALSPGGLLGDSLL